MSTHSRTPPQIAIDQAAAPPVVDRASFQAQLDSLRVREKAHTREGDAIAAARRRLPMVEVDAATELTVAQHAPAAHRTRPAPFAPAAPYSVGANGFTPCAASTYHAVAPV